MSTLKMLKEHLDEKGIFQLNLPSIVTSSLDVITNDAPEKMKLAMAVSELILLTSHMRKNIILADGTKVPMNAITMILAPSGASKDSSMNSLRSTMKDAYKTLDEHRETYARERAEAEAEASGNTGQWQRFYKKPKPIFAAISTAEGFMQHMSDLEQGDIGSAYLQVTELGSEMQSNPNMTDNIRLIAMAYDLGAVAAKIIKSNETQTKPILNLPVSALLFGSQDNILFDEVIKNKFKMEFGTKLARRTIFNFNQNDVKAPEFKNVQELIDYRTEKETRAIKAGALLKEASSHIMENSDNTDINVDKEATDLFFVYKEYNVELADTISAQFPLSKLARAHNQWKALKLAGNFAMLNGETTVSIGSYIQAISYIEYLSNDLMLFEQELVKEDYEMFVEYMRAMAEDNKARISLHNLRKMGYISGGGSAGKMDELAKLASSYDDSGIYSSKESAIEYEGIVKTDISGVSWKHVSGTKEQRAKACADGFVYTEIDFEQMTDLLTLDTAYNTFQFIDGKRGNDYITGGTKMIVLDIDDSDITDEEAHDMLDDIKHIVVRTSNKDNPFKFRVIVELDSYADIPMKMWKMFIKSIADSLGLEVDLLPKSQIYFSWTDRIILSSFEGEVLSVKEHMTNAYEMTKTKESQPSEWSASKKSQTLKTSMFNLLDFAYNAQHGERSRSLIRAAHYLRDLDQTRENTIETLNDILHYWDDEFDPVRYERTVLQQLARWTFHGEEKDKVSSIKSPIFKES